MADSSSLVKVCFDLNVSTAKLSKWKVKAGSHISQGTVLLLYDDGTPITKKWKAPRDGTITELLAKEGDMLHNGCVLMSLKGCLHPVIMKDMCADCGADLRESKDERMESFASVSMVHSVPELRVSKEQAQLLGRADEQRLLKSRKLVLLVDLDQTLIHTTNDDVPPNLKDVHHFQLYGANSPWYHARLRPGTKEFLAKVGRLFELHICTFGARLYAHTVANILDSDGRFFSHRILSRDECFSANSKTANLKALFPCGDNMVVIIDDREDVWNFAPNVVHVKPYHFFQHTGDINAPPGMTKTESDGETTEKGPSTGRYLLGKRIKRISKGGAGRPTTVSGKSAPAKVAAVSTAVEPDSALSKSTPKVATAQPATPPPDAGQLDQEKPANAECKDESPPEPIAIDEEAVADNGDIKIDETPCELKGDAKMNEDDEIVSEVVASDQNGVAVSDRADEVVDKSEVSEVISHDQNGVAVNDPAEDGVDKSEVSEVISYDQNGVAVNDPAKDGVDKSGVTDDIGLSGEQGCVKSDALTTSTKKATVSQVSEENVEGVTIAHTPSSSPDDPSRATPVSMDTSDSPRHMPDEAASDVDDDDEDNVIEVEDTDDYLLYLADILANIHSRFYATYDTSLSEGGDVIPDMKDVVPRVRRHILHGVRLVFSGVIPTNVKMEKCRAYYLARTMGAEIQPALVVGGAKGTTHMVAARIGTVKVTEARRVRGLHIVTPVWLWSCAERWERVDEAMFPLTRETSGREISRHELMVRRPDGPPTDGLAALAATAPTVTETFPTYDPVTGKRINVTLRAKGPSREPVSDAMPDAMPDTTAGPSGTPPAPPTFAESIPQMMALSKEDIEKMDREVEDLMDDSDGSEDNDGVEDDDRLGCLPAKFKRANSRGSSSSSSSNESLSADNPRGWKRKAAIKRRSPPTPCSGGSGSSSPPKFPRSELPEDSDRSAADSSESTADGESVGSVDEEMAAAVEREFLRM